VGLLSYRYEPVIVTVERLVERTLQSKGWVTKYRLISTIVRVVVTRVTYVLLSPDGLVEVSRYVIPTRYIETEYYLPPVTHYLGVVRPEEDIRIAPVERETPVKVVTPTPAPAPAPTPAMETAKVAV
jgi:hypothetical protein